MRTNQTVRWSPAERKIKKDKMFKFLKTPLPIQGTGHRAIAGILKAYCLSYLVLFLLAALVATGGILIFLFAVLAFSGGGLAGLGLGLVGGFGFFIFVVGLTITTATGLILKLFNHLYLAWVRKDCLSVAKYRFFGSAFLLASGCIMSLLLLALGDLMHLKRNFILILVLPTPLLFFSGIPMVFLPFPKKTPQGENPLGVPSNPLPEKPLPMPVSANQGIPSRAPVLHQYSCPRCHRNYTLQVLPRPGSLCPACRQP